MHTGVVLWTVGHSNQPGAAFIEALVRAQIELIVDVRRFPQSRRNPQFNRDNLAQALATEGIDYLHVPELGGRREPGPESQNTALRDEGFRGFADYMQTLAFESALAALIEKSELQRAAIMCAEGLPWRCHRSLIADALVARGIEVEHLLQGKARTHTLTPSARVVEGRVSYAGLL